MVSLKYAGSETLSASFDLSSWFLASPEFLKESIFWSLLFGTAVQYSSSSLSNLLLPSSLFIQVPHLKSSSRTPYAIAPFVGLADCVDKSSALEVFAIR